MLGSPTSSALQALLRQAAAAARTGDLDEAERLYRRLLDQDPDNVEAWLGLGSVVKEPGEKAACFRRVLELDPQNEDAEASLNRLQATLPDEEETLTCAFHPQVETVLRCSQCGRPICVRCAQHYPVGQLCPECVRGRRPVNYQPHAAKLAAAGAASLAAGMLAGLLGMMIGSIWILAIVGGPLVGSGLAQVALWAGRRQRGLAMQITVGACAALGCLLGALFLNPGLFVRPSLGFLIYLVLTIGSTVSWLR